MITEKDIVKDISRKESHERKRNLTRAERITLMEEKADACEAQGFPNSARSFRNQANRLRRAMGMQVINYENS